MRAQAHFIGAIFLLALAVGLVSAQNPDSPTPDVVYVPTKQTIVDAMLKLAKVSENDLVYDLGCGDGRIVIAAAKQFGAKGIGIEIDRKLVKLANENAEREKVADKVKFIEADIFRTDFRRATVVMLYLSPSVNLRLRARLIKQLKPGARIVSHDFDLGDWKPDQTIKVENATLHLWTVPAKKPKIQK